MVKPNINIKVLINGICYSLSDTDLLNNIVVSNIKRDLLEHFNNHNTILNNKLYNELSTSPTLEIKMPKSIHYISNKSLTISLDFNEEGIYSFNS